MSIARTAPAPKEAARPAQRSPDIWLRWQLMLLIAAGVVPLLVFNISHQYFQYRSDVAATGARTLELARTMSQVIEAELRAQVLVTQTLASFDALRSGNLEDFRGRAQTVIEEQFPGANIVVLRPDGQALMNLRIPAGDTLPVRADLDSIHQVLSTGEPAVSNLFLGARTGRPVVAIDAPVRATDGSIRYILSINPRLEAFDEAIRGQRLSANWVVSIFDRKGINVARAPNSVKFVGHPASPSLSEPLQSQAEGIVDTTSLEGIPLLSAFSHGGRFGWSVAIGIPRAELIGPVVSGALRTLMAGGVMLIVGLMLALHVAKRIASSVAGYPDKESSA